MRSLFCIHEDILESCVSSAFVLSVSGFVWPLSVRRGLPHRSDSWLSPHMASGNGYTLFFYEGVYDRSYAFMHAGTHGLYTCIWTRFQTGVSSRHLSRFLAQSGKLCLPADPPRSHSSPQCVTTTSGRVGVQWKLPPYSSGPAQRQHRG